MISELLGAGDFTFQILFFTTLRLNHDIQFDSLIDIELELALCTAIM